MKIKNLKYSFEAMTLVFMISLTGCGNHTSTVKFEEPTEIIQMQEETIAELEEKETDVVLTASEANTIVEKIQKDTTYWTYYSDNELMLKDYNYERVDNCIFGDIVYSNINQLLSRSTTTDLYLEDTNFDLSKLNIANLKKISLVNIKLENAKEIMNLATQNNIKLEYVLYSDIEESSKVINYIAENNIVCENLSLIANNERELLEFSKLLEKVNANSITLTLKNNESDNNDIMDINVKLNDNTKEFNLNLDYLYEGVSLGNRELGNIEIISNNESLSISLNEILITENTNFIIPNNINIFLSGSHFDTEPFYDLEDVSLLYYSNDEVYTGYSYVALDGNFDETINQISNVNTLVKKNK